MTAWDLWRSKDMSHLRLVIQREACHDVVQYVGKNTKVMFDDLCPEKTAFEREFAAEVQRCSEVEHKVTFVRRQIEISGFDVPEQVSVNNIYMDDVEQQLEEFEARIVELNKQRDQLKRTKRELRENEVLINEVEYLVDPNKIRNNDVGDISVVKAPGIGSSDIESRTSSSDQEQRNIINDDSVDSSFDNNNKNLDEEGDVRHSREMELGFSIITGLVSANNVEAMTKIMFRIMKGNVIIRTSDAHITLKDPQSGKTMDKVAFIVFFSARKFSEKLHQMCLGAGASLYDVSRADSGRVVQRKKISAELAEAKRMLKYNKDQRKAEIMKIAPYADAFSNYIIEEKTIYHVMNMFRSNSSSGSGFLIAEGWIPTSEFPLFTNAVTEADTRSAASVSTDIVDITNEVGHKKVKTPTYFPVNRFAKNFQGVSDAYGIPNYKEINPGFFYTFTFPFLFAIMFGDIAHGFINACCAIVMVILEKKLKNSKGGMNDIIEILFAGRYMILLMCCMSVIVGVFYNEAFGLGWRTFGSAFYSRPYDGTNNYIKDEGQANIFGMDTMWLIADNAMTFTNSYKMKMAIILGISHMTLGLILKLLNYIKFRDLPGFFFTWLPQIIFFGIIFFYMCFLVIYKWFHLYETVDNNGVDCTKYAPSIITTMINLFLGFGSVGSDEVLYGFDSVVKEEGDVDDVKYKEEVTKVQSTVQLAIVVIVIISVVWLLFSKLVYIGIVKCKRKKSNHNGIVEHGETIIDDANNSNASVSSEEVDMSSRDNSSSNNETNEKKQINKTSGVDEEDEEEDETTMPFGELIVHQGISVIEFCIGCISHTASYLRLWALSLAHSQLAEVFFEIMVQSSITTSDSSGAPMGVLMGVFGCWAWLFFSLAVLCLMECLSAFLHTLRLHWVEYQDKFFGGEGIKFEPVKFESCTPIENSTYVVQKEINKEKETEKKLVDKELMKDRKKRMQA